MSAIINIFYWGGFALILTGFALDNWSVSVLGLMWWTAALTESRKS